MKKVVLENFTLFTGVLLESLFNKVTGLKSNICERLQILLGTASLVTFTEEILVMENFVFCVESPNYLNYSKKQADVAFHVSKKKKKRKEKKEKKSSNRLKEFS